MSRTMRVMSGNLQRAVLKLFSKSESGARGNLFDQRSSLLYKPNASNKKRQVTAVGTNCERRCDERWRRGVLAVLLVPSVAIW